MGPFFVFLSPRPCSDKFSTSAKFCRVHAECVLAPCLRCLSIIHSCSCCMSVHVHVAYPCLMSSAADPCCLSHLWTYSMKTQHGMQQDHAVLTWIPLPGSWWPDARSYGYPAGLYSVSGVLPLKTTGSVSLVWAGQTDYFTSFWIISLSIFVQC